MSRYGRCRLLRLQKGASDGGVGIAARPYLSRCLKTDLAERVALAWVRLVNKRVATNTDDFLGTATPKEQPQRQLLIPPKLQRALAILGPAPAKQVLVVPIMSKAAPPPPPPPPPPSPVTNCNSRIVVIGAGASGIAAATRLIKAGFRNVSLVEAEGRIGGRVNTVPFADNVVDLGAQWCHGEKGNVIYEQVRDLKLLEETGSMYDDYKCVRSTRQILPDELVEPLKTIAFNTIGERQRDLVEYEGSLGSYMTDKFWAEYERHRGEGGCVERPVAAEFLENYKKFECSVEAADHLFEVSGKGHLEYHLCDGELLLHWRDRGFVTLLRLLMGVKRPEDPQDLGCLRGRVRFNTRIEQIDWSQKPVRLRCWNGDLIEADHVICTVSLGVLQENHQRLFQPALPAAKCRAIRGLRLGTVDKFFLEFAQPFRPDLGQGFAFLWTDEHLAELRKTDYFWLESVFGFWRVSCQPRILQGWTIGPHARHMEALPEAEVRAGIMWLLRRFFDFPVPEPINFVRTRWYTNPNFRGSYSFRSMLTDELRTGAWDLAQPLTNLNREPVVQFAGEATHSHFYSTVHGAVESGWREADRLVALYEGRTVDCPVPADSTASAAIGMPAVVSKL